MSRAALKAPTAEAKLSDDARREWRRTAEGYTLALPDLGIALHVTRLRRDGGALIGEVRADCDLPGARTVCGTLSIADLNFSSLTARGQRARHFEERSRAHDVGWDVLVEEFAQRVIEADREGSPTVSLRDVLLPKAEDDAREVLGVPLLLRLPLVLFGDGGSAKSYLGLYMAGELARQGVRVGYLDWELEAVDHRVRLGSIYGAAMPEIRYKRCDRPLTHMRDEVLRMVRAEGLQYLVFDSIAFACDTKPEDAEAAQRYLQTVRATGVGSLHIAHISKAEGGDQKPFGSVFWHNGARATWFVKPAAGVPSGGRLHLALLHRKANTGPKLSPRGVRVTFGDGRTSFERADLRDVPELAPVLPTSQRVRAALRRGPLSQEALAEELDDVKADTLKKAVMRELKAGKLVRFPGAGGQVLIGLAEPGGRDE